MDDAARAVGKAESTKNDTSSVCLTRKMENKYKPDYFVCFLLWYLLSGNIQSGNSSFSTVLQLFTNVWG